jgi:hypothetical protein
VKPLGLSRFAALWLLGSVVAFIIVVVPRDAHTPMRDWVGRFLHVVLRSH